MRSTFQVVSILFLLFLILALSAVGDLTVPDGTIYGHVYDAETGVGIYGAYVLCEGYKDATDAEGRYVIKGGFAPSASYTVTCYASVYPDSSKTVNTDHDGKVEADFNLESEEPAETPKTSDRMTTATWCKTFGGSDPDVGNSVKQTSDGGFIITGETSSYDTDGSDVWLIKTDSRGNKEWDRTFDKSDTDGGFSVDQTDDGGFIIAGYTFSHDALNADLWLIKTDSRGNKEWERTFGCPYWDSGNSIQQTSDGGFIITGETLYCGADFHDVWLIKTDSRGNKEWDRTFGGSDSDLGNSVQQTSDGGWHNLLFQ
jgi:hypothetical protein